MMSKINCFFIALSFIFTMPTIAWAVDLDDDIKPDTTEHITYNSQDSTTSQSAEIEKKFPEEAKQVRDALQRHISHANSLDLDGYLSDFLPEKVRYPDLERDYAKRAMELKDLKLEIHSIEFQKLNRTSATVHTRQIASYTDDAGSKIVDDAIISYRWIKDANDQVWRIAFTERKRLVSNN